MEKVMLYLLLPTFFVGVLVTAVNVVALVFMKKMQEALAKRNE